MPVSAHENLKSVLDKSSTDSRCLLVLEVRSSGSCWIRIINISFILSNLVACG